MKKKDTSLTLQWVEEDGAWYLVEPGYIGPLEDAYYANIAPFEKEWMWFERLDLGHHNYWNTAPTLEEAKRTIEVNLSVALANRFSKFHIQG